MPQPLFGSKKWDRRAIDLVLDRASGIAKDASPARVETPYQKWKRESEETQSSFVQRPPNFATSTARDKFNWRDQTPPATPLGKREIRALKVIAAAEEAGRDLCESEINGSSEVTIWKMTLRGLLHDRTVKRPYLRLTTKGKEAFAELCENEDRQARVARMKAWQEPVDD